MGEGNGGIVMGKSNGTGDLRFNFAGTNALSLGKDYATTDLNRTTSNSTVTMSAWNYVVVTWDGSATATNILIYVNGAETTYQTTTNGVGAIQSDAALNFNIGNLSGLFHTFDGVIDEVKVSNVARSASWITADYNAQKRLLRSLVGGRGRLLPSLFPELPTPGTELRWRWQSMEHSLGKLAQPLPRLGPFLE